MMSSTSCVAFFAVGAAGNPVIVDAEPRGLRNEPVDDNIRHLEDEGNGCSIVRLTDEKEKTVGQVQELMKKTDTVLFNYRTGKQHTPQSIIPGTDKLDIRPRDVFAICPKQATVDQVPCLPVTVKEGQDCSSIASDYLLLIGNVLIKDRQDGSKLKTCTQPLMIGDTVLVCPSGFTVTTKQPTNGEVPTVLDPPMSSA